MQTDPVKECVWWTALTGRVKEDNDKIKVFREPHFSFGNAFEDFFCGKTLGFRAQTIASVTCQQKQGENAAASDFVDKVLWRAWAAFKYRALLLTLLHLRIYVGNPKA